MIYWTAIVMGLVANLHCLGMCGPIALAVPIKNNSTFARWKSALSYNLGRITVYALLGTVLGLLGEGIELIGMQQIASIAFGLMILIIGLVPVVSNRLFKLNGTLFSSISALKKTFASLLKHKSYPAIVGIGALNGLLPCGMVYLALVGAVATGSVVQGALFMTLFGLGTLPVMLALPLVGSLLSPRIRSKFRTILPVVTLCFGLLLIARGSNLGIPYFSPQKSTEVVGSTLQCH